MAADQLGWPYHNLPAVKHFAHYHRAEWPYLNLPAGDYSAHEHEDVIAEQLGWPYLDLPATYHSAHDHGADLVATVGEEQLRRKNLDLSAADPSVHGH